MKKILLISLLSSLSILGSETIIVSGGADAILKSDKEIEEALIVVRGGSKISCNSVGDLRVYDLKQGARINLPHIPDNGQYLRMADTNNNNSKIDLPANYKRKTVFTVNEKKVEITVKGGSKLSLPIHIKRIYLKADGGAQVQITKHIKNLNVINIDSSAAITYNKFGTLLHGIKKTPSIITNSIGQLFKKLLSINNHMVNSENPIIQRPVFNTRILWKKLPLPAQPVEPGDQAAPPA